MAQLVPRPVAQTRTGGSIRTAMVGDVLTEHGELLALAEILAGWLDLGHAQRGSLPVRLRLDPAVSGSSDHAAGGPSDNAVSGSSDHAGGGPSDNAGARSADEAYRLVIGADGIECVGAGAAGVARAAATLAHLYFDRAYALEAAPPEQLG